MGKQRRPFTSRRGRTEKATPPPRRRLPTQTGTLLRKNGGIAGVRLRCRMSETRRRFRSSSVHGRLPTYFFDPHTPKVTLEPHIRVVRVLFFFLNPFCLNLYSSS